jgi:glycosyltransferase involved in cell wall biosynthesis
MKILGICLSAGKGGLELYAQKAISSLQQRGHDCHFAIAPDSYLRRSDWSLPVLELRPWLRLFPLFTAWRLARYLDARQIDVLHMHWNKDLNLVAMARWLSRCKPKVIYSRHMGITRAKKDLYHRALYSQVDRMLVIAKFVQAQAIRFLPLAEDHIALLYLGVKAPAKASAQECSELLQGVSTRDDQFVIGMIGRIEHGKGQHVLIDALAVLNQQQLPVLIAMAGPVMDQSYFDMLNRRIREQGTADKIRYLGISREPDKLMSCCDVVVLTTFCETFGLVLVESMRAGTPVIATDAGGVPEIIQHNETGLLYEPGNARQLADSISELLHDKNKRARLARAGKTFADTMFDEKQHFENLEKIFNTL